jgi:transcriptional regulator with XRE-family HTH domain
MNASETLLRQVAVNLRAARQALGWSQQVLADRAEVSLRMVAALEAGNSNVSLATLDRLAHALGSTFAELVREPSRRSGETGPVLVWQGESPRSRARLLQSVPASGTLELWDWSLGAGERYDAEADRPGIREMVYVISGTLTLELGDEVETVAAGQSIAYSSDRSYAYVNAGDSPVRFLRNTIG